MTSSPLTRYVHSFDPAIKPSREAVVVSELLMPLIQAPPGLAQEPWCSSSSVDSDVAALRAAGWKSSGGYWCGHSGAHVRRVDRSDLLKTYEEFSFEYVGLPGQTLAVEFDDRKPGYVTIITPHLSEDMIREALRE
jgi:hypothetical protein